MSNRRYAFWFSRLTALCCALFSGLVFGQCSEYMGRASINEISTEHNWRLNYGDYVEVKLLDNSIPTSITDEWSLMICSNTCNWDYLSTFTKSSAYFTRGDNFVWGFISWRTSFDVILRDKWGYTIDYVSVNGHSALSPACTTQYDSTATSDTSTRRTIRLPDGSGDWDTPPGNSVPPTEGESNTTPPVGAATLSIDDASADQGSNMVFNLSVPGNTYTVTIQYSTFDGTAVAGTDYTATSGTLTIPPGTESATITVPTLASGATAAKEFYLLLDSVEYASAPDQVAIGTINSATLGIDHYRIEYDGSALTCQSETITVKACTNADCSTLYASPASVTFDVSTAEPSSSTASLTFTGSATVDVAESSVTTVTVGLSAQSPSGNVQCYENGTLDASCNYTTTDTGFLFLNQSAGNDVIPTQIAARPSDVGTTAATIVLQAVQTDTNSGACAPLFADNSLVAVDLSYQCENPSSCTQAVVIGNTNEIPNPDQVNAYTIGKYGTYTTHNLYFKTDSKAIINITYPDVGQIKLYARKSVDLGGTIPSGETKVLTGSSKSFVVRPFGFYIGLSGNPGATDNTGGVFKKAGEPFDTSISAVQWTAADDIDNNGIPDTHDGLSDNPVAPNFGQESPNESVTVSSSLLSPAGGNNAALSNSTFTAFSNGVSSRTGANGMSWADVGSIALTASDDGDYLGSGAHVSTTLSAVGRFVPSHFRLLSATVTPACANTFSYMGQNFSLSMNLAAQGVGDIALANYDSGSGTDFHGLASFSVVAENADDGNDLGSRLSAIGGNWVDGVINQTYTASFSRLSGSPWIDGPFDNLFLGLKVTDNDTGAAIALIDNAGGGTNMNAATSGACVVGGSCDALKLTSSELRIRYGRMRSESVFGPAAEPLQLPLRTEYFDGSGFSVNTLDNCSALVASEVNLSGSVVSPFAAAYAVKDLLNGSNVGTTTVDTSVANTSTTGMNTVNGEFNLTLTAPILSTGISGYVPVFIDLTNYPWLMFDWDTNGTGPADTLLPTQNVTFGQYRGNDRVIYWREKK